MKSKIEKPPKEKSEAKSKQEWRDRKLFKNVPFSKGAAFAALLIFLAVLAVYSNSINSAFHMDDYGQIVENGHISSLENLTRFFTGTRDAAGFREGNGYRPVTTLSFAVSYGISGLKPWGYHLINLLVHFLNSLLLFFMLNSFLLKRRSGAFYLSLLIAVLFAVHPVQTNAVTYVSGRAVLLATFFCFLSLLCFLRAGADDGRRRYNLALAAVSFFFALLSKEMAAGMLGVLALYWLLLDRPKQGRRFAPITPYLPFIAVLAVFLVLKIVMQGAVTPVENYSTADYLMSESKVLIMYARLLFLPFNQNFDYYLPETGSFDFGVGAAVVLLGMAVYLLYRSRKSNPLVTFFGFWFLACLAPESTLVPITDIAEEYRVYMASAGLLTAAALLADGLVRQGTFRKALPVSAVLLMGLLTFNRNVAWKTDYSLWSDTVSKSPNSIRAHYSLGQAMMEEKKMYPEAAAEMEYSLRLDPSYPKRFFIYNNLGICYYDMGMTDRAVQMFKAAAEDSVSGSRALRNLGEIYFYGKKYSDAADVLERAVQGDPEDVHSRLLLAKTFYLLGRGPDARTEASQALNYAIDPKDRKEALSVLRLVGQS